MAARYWVGGTGTWSSTNTANWSATSGGTGGASVPTSGDTPIFNSLSGTGTVTYTGVATVGAITLSGAGITLSLGAALTSSGSITVTAGSLLTNGYTLSSSSLISTSGTRTIDLGNSTVILSSAATALNFINNGITFDAGTSTISLSGSSCTFAGGGLTFNNVRFTSSLSTTRTVTGNNTFNGTLYIERYSTTGIANFVFSAGQTINELDARSSTSAANRVFIRSDTLGTNRTLTIDSLVTAVSDYDFRDITIAGAVAPLSGTRLGDCLRNSGIIFTSKTVYWNLAAGGSWSSIAWATTEGGTPSSTNFPLAQDTVVFPVTGLNNAATVTLNSAYGLGTIDMSARTSGTSTMTFTTAASPTVYGNWINGTGVSFSGLNTFTFSAESPQTILSAGRTFTQSFTFVNTSSVTLLDNFRSSSTSRITLTSGTLDLNNFNLTAGTLGLTGTTPRTLNTGTGVITLSGLTSYVVDMLTTTALTVTGDRNLVITGISASDSSARSCLFGTPDVGKPFNVTVTLGRFSFSITNVGEFDNLIFTNFTGSTNTNSITVEGDFELSSGQTFSLVPTFIGTKVGRLFTTNGAVISSAITFNGVGGSWILQDALTSSNTTTNAIRVLGGSLDLNGKTVTTAGTFSSTGSLVRDITFNGGLVVLTGGGSVCSLGGSNISLSKGSAAGTVRLTSASAKTFAGGGLNLPLILDQAGAGALTITGSNTFEDIVNNYSTVGATTIIFPNSTTTVKNFTAKGSAGNLLTIDNATTNGTLGVIALSSGGSVTSVDYLNVQDLSFTPFSTDGSNPYTWYAGANSVNSGNNTGIAFIDSATTKAYLLLSGSSWTVPEDWNNDNNAIHMIGGGGGGGGSKSSTVRQSGGGGGGAGYTVLTNQNLSGTVAYTVGAGGAGGSTGNSGTTGGATLWNSGLYTANGGNGAPAAILNISPGGAGGVGLTSTGGSGGSGINGADVAGGGGGGAAGPNGNGGNGGTGGGVVGGSGSTSVSGAGGGGNGGGTNGSNGSTTATLSGGAGGNNFNGVGGGATKTTAGSGNRGTLGGGGSGSAGAYSSAGGAGGAGIDILNTVGGGGGAGSGASATQAATGLYGAGGAGGGTNAGLTSTAGSGAQGMIFIVYAPTSAPPVISGGLGNFLMFF